MSDLSGTFITVGFVMCVTPQHVWSVRRSHTCDTCSGVRGPFPSDNRRDFKRNIWNIISYKIYLTTPYSQCSYMFSSDSYWCTPFT